MRTGDHLLDLALQAFDQASVEREESCVTWTNTSREPQAPAAGVSPAKLVRPKVAAAGIGGAVTTIALYVLSEAAGVEVPPEIASAIAVVVAFSAGYLKGE